MAPCQRLLDEADSLASLHSGCRAPGGHFKNYQFVGLGVFGPHVILVKS